MCAPPIPSCSIRICLPRVMSQPFIMHRSQSMMVFGVSVAPLSEECEALYKHQFNKCYLSIIAIKWPCWNNQPAISWSFSLLQPYLAWWNSWHTYCVLWFPDFPCSFHLVPYSFRASFGGGNLIFKECLFSNCETGKKNHLMEGCFINCLRNLGQAL